MKLVVDLDDKASKGLDRIGKESKGLGGILSGVGLGIGASIVPMVGELASGLWKAGEAAMAEKADIDRLNQTLANSIPNWDGNTAAIDTYISKQEQMAFADDQIRNSLNLLVAQTGDLTEAQALQATAMDLARFGKIDLAAATKLMLKADDESFAALGKLGIQIDKTATKEEALAQIRSQTAGQAETYANSAAGSMEKIQNAFGNAVEDIGGVIMPKVTEALGFVSSFISSPQFQQGFNIAIDLIGTKLGEAFNFISGIVTAVWPTIQQVFGFMTGPTVQGPLEQLRGSLMEGIGGAFTFLGQVATTVGPILQNIWNYLTSPEVISTLQQIGSAIMEGLGNAFTFLGQVGATVGPIIQEIWNYLTSPEVTANIMGVADALMTGLGGAFTFLQETVIPIVTNIFNELSKFWTEISPQLTEVWNNIVAGVQVAWPIVSEIISTGVQVIQQLWNDVWPGIQQTFSGVWEMIQGIAQTAWSIVSGIFNTGLALLQGDWEGAWTAIQEMFAGVWEGIQTTLSGAWETVQGIINIGLGQVKQLWESVWGGISSFFSNLWNGIVSFLSNAWLTIQGEFQTKTAAIRKIWDEMWEGVKKFLSDTWNNIVTTVQTKIQEVFDKLGEIKDFLLGLPGQLAGAAMQIGKDIIGGIVGGLQAVGGQIVDFIMGLAGDALQGIKDFFGISSPSKVMIEQGEYIGMGLAIGIGNSTDMVVGAVIELGKSVGDAVGKIEVPPIGSDVVVGRGGDGGNIIPIGGPGGGGNVIPLPGGSGVEVGGGGGGGVIPLGMRRGGGGANININITAGIGVSSQAIAEEVSKVLRTHANLVGLRAV